MATTEVGVERRRRPPDAVYKVLNPLFGLILRSPLHRPLSGRLALLTYTGRKSGASYTLPVGYVQADENMVLLGTESGWKVNLRGGPRVRFLLRGRWRDGTAEVIDSQEGMVAALTTMVTRAPQYGQIAGVRLGADGKVEATDVSRARARGSVVVCIWFD